jgi:hypothetical protein
MKTYLADSIDRRTIVLREGEREAGTLEYKGWFSQKAAISIGQAVSYDVIRHGFFMQSITIGKGIDVYMAVRLAKWHPMQFTITRQGIEYRMRLKRKKLFGLDYVLVDDNSEELMLIKPDFQWRKLRYNYEVDVHDTASRYADEPIFILAVLYILMLLQRRHAAAASG